MTAACTVFGDYRGLSAAIPAKRPIPRQHFPKHRKPPRAGLPACTVHRRNIATGRA